MADEKDRNGDLKLIEDSQGIIEALQKSDLESPDPYMETGDEQQNIKEAINILEWNLEEREKGLNYISAVFHEIDNISYNFKKSGNSEEVVILSNLANRLGEIIRENIETKTVEESNLMNNKESPENDQKLIEQSEKILEKIKNLGGWELEEEALTDGIGFLKGDKNVALSDINSVVSEIRDASFELANDEWGNNEAVTISNLANRVEEKAKEQSIERDSYTEPKINFERNNLEEIQNPKSNQDDNTIDENIVRTALETQIINAETVWTKLQEYEHFENIPIEQGALNLLFEADMTNREKNSRGVFAGDDRSSARLLTRPLEAAILIQNQGQSDVTIPLRFEVENGGLIPDRDNQYETLEETSRGLSPEFWKNGTQVLQEANGLLAANIKRQVQEINDSLQFLKDNKEGLIGSVRAKAIVAIEERRERRNDVYGTEVKTKLQEGTTHGAEADLRFSVEVKGKNGTLTGEARVFLEKDDDLHIIAKKDGSLENFHNFQEAVQQAVNQDSKHYRGVAEAVQIITTNQRIAEAQELIKPAQSLKGKLTEISNTLEATQEKEVSLEPGQKNERSR